MDVEMKVAGLKHSNPDKLMKDTFHSIVGVDQVDIFATEGLVKITYDQEAISLDTICDIIEDLGCIVDR